MDSAEKTLIIYHDNCPDGFASALAAKMALGDAAELAPYGHEEKRLPNFEGRRAVFLDCCPPREALLQARAQSKSLLVLDHHKSAREDCGDLGCCRFDMDRSGAGMSWDYFFPGEKRPWLFEHVQDRDLWRFELPGTRAFCQALDALPRDFETWLAVARMDEEQKAEFLKKGEAMLEQFEYQCQQIAQSATLADFLGNRVWALNAPHAFADRCGEILYERGDADYALIWSSKDLRSAKLSMRSKIPFDVSVVATRLGGGGHAQAAGAMMGLADLMAALSPLGGKERA